MLTPAFIGAISAAAVSLLVAILGAITKFSINKATATKISVDAGTVKQTTDAATAEVFNRLAAEWTLRADLRVESLEKRIGHLCDAIETLATSVDHVVPLLEESYPESQRVIDLKLANIAARRIGI
jgi:hypothetical protein